MMASFLPMILMLLGTSGGFNELLDLTDPEAYLKSQGVEYTIGALIEVLGEPRTKDLSQMKAQEVKKLLAMRALGELKDKSALPALQKAATSKTLFFDDYAASAIAAIEGKDPVLLAAVSAEQLKGDLALLPEGVGLVMQARLTDGGIVDLKKLAAEALKGMPDGPKPAEVLTTVSRELSGLFAQIGNARLDAVTLGLSEQVGDDVGFVVIIGRGKYDHRAVESALSEQKRTTHHEIGGTMFLGMDGDDAAIAPVSSELFVFVAGAGWEHFPLEKVAAKLKAKPAEPVFSAALKKVIARADQRGSLWGAGMLPQELRDEAPPLAPFEEIVLSTAALKEKPGKTLLKVEGSGKDNKAISAAVAEMKQGLEQGIGEIEGQRQPGLEGILKVMKSIRISSMNSTATATAEFDGDPSSALSTIVPMLMPRMAQPGRAPGP